MHAPATKQIPNNHHFTGLTTFVSFCQDEPVHWPTWVCSLMLRYAENPRRGMLCALQWDAKSQPARASEAGSDWWPSNWGRNFGTKIPRFRLLQAMGQIEIFQFNGLRRLLDLRPCWYSSGMDHAGRGPWNETWQHKPTPSNTNLFATPRDGIRRPCSFQGVPPRTSPRKWMAFSLSALQARPVQSCASTSLAGGHMDLKTAVIIPIYSHHANTNWHVLSPHTLCCTVVSNDRPISSLHGVLVPTTQNGEYITVSWLGLYHPFIVQDSPSLPPWRHLCIASAGSCTVFQGCGRKWWVVFKTTQPPSEKISTCINSELATIKQRTSMQLGSHHKATARSGRWAFCASTVSSLMFPWLNLKAGSVCTLFHQLRWEIPEIHNEHL